MTQTERTKLIEKMSVQLFRAKQLRQGVVLSHQLVEQLVNDLKRLQKMEREREQALANPSLGPTAPSALAHSRNASGNAHRDVYQPPRLSEPSVPLGMDCPPR